MIEKYELKNDENLAGLLDLDLNLIKRVIRGLLFFEMIEKSNDIYVTTEIPKYSIHFSDILNLKIYLIQKFREKIGDYPNWMKNAANLLIIEYLFHENKVIVDYKDQMLIDEINNYFFNVRSYNPLQRGGGETIKLNSNKLENWCEIFGFLGFVKKISSTQYIFDIDNDILFGLISIFSIKMRDDVIPLDEFISWINKNYFLIPLDGSKIPEILCKKLYSLCQKEKIKFLKHGDSQIMDLTNKPNYLNIPSTINAIKIIES